MSTRTARVASVSVAESRRIRPTFTTAGIDLNMTAGFDLNIRCVPVRQVLVTSLPILHQCGLQPGDLRENMPSADVSRNLTVLSRRSLQQDAADVTAV